MIEIEKGSANIYKDLGFSDAAEILGMPQPELSGMLRGQFRGISEAKMLECMNRLGRDVQIVVRKPSRSGATGRTSVVFA
jgi:predicted XRE-type DNA-binding protein